MIFRPIVVTDINSCSVLYTQVFSSNPWNEPWEVNVARERLTHFQKSKGFVGMLAETDHLMGFALGNIEPFHSGAIFYLREMCVVSNAQNQGIGKSILKKLEIELRAKHVERIYLATERDIVAASFYQKNGFNHIDDMGFYAKRI